MDTIAAISSAVGAAGRIILRISGAEAISIAKGLAAELPGPGEAARVWLSFRDLRLPAWAYLFRSPRSYTGEDLVELHIPGSPVLANLLLGELLADRARLAEPGEFTARAYFNGRMDLTEAEGVAAAVSASNEQEMAAARRLMAGELARRLVPITNLIAQTLALTEVGIDFSDEEVSFLSVAQCRKQILAASELLDTLLRESPRFERLAHEPRIVLVGRPNAGKSTLLNALAGQQRAIVSPVAGTTRDVLSVDLPLQRGVAQLLDVAGLEPVPDDGQSPSEEHRIARLMRAHAFRTVEAADLVLRVTGCDDDRPPVVLPRKPDWIVRTKCDRCPTARANRDGETLVSAVTSTGLIELKQVLDTLAFGETTISQTLAINARHVRAIEEARAALDRALAQVEGGAELLAMELREALDAVGTVGGRITPDDVLGRVFSAFCIGK